MKITNEQLKQIIKEELEAALKEYGPVPDEYMSDEPVDSCADYRLQRMDYPYGEYAKMSIEQLLKIMCKPGHFKSYYHASMELSKRGYEGWKPEAPWGDKYK